MVSVIDPASDEPVVSDQGIPVGADVRSFFQGGQFVLGAMRPTLTAGIDGC